MSTNKTDLNNNLPPSSSLPSTYRPSAAAALALMGTNNLVNRLLLGPQLSSTLSIQSTIATNSSSVAVAVDPQRHSPPAALTARAVAFGESTPMGDEISPRALTLPPPVFSPPSALAMTHVVHFESPRGITRGDLPPISTGAFDHRDSPPAVTPRTAAMITTPERSPPPQGSVAFHDISLFGSDRSASPIASHSPAVNKKESPESPEGSPGLGGINHSRSPSAVVLDMPRHPAMEPVHTADTIAQLPESPLPSSPPMFYTVPSSGGVLLAPSSTTQTHTVPSSGGVYVPPAVTSGPVPSLPVPTPAEQLPSSHRTPLGGGRTVINNFIRPLAPAASSNCPTSHRVAAVACVIIVIVVVVLAVKLSK